VESSGRERLMMGGKAGKAVRSKIYSPEAHGVNSGVWVQERAGHKGQGSSPRPEHPANLSQVSAPDVRYCQIHVVTCGKERFIKLQITGLPPPPHPRGQGESSLAEMSGVFYRRGQAMGEGESLWSLIICDHQMEWVDMPG
jgi:hypothetical protein